jgi:hypothetical protein
VRGLYGVKQVWWHVYKGPLAGAIATIICEESPKAPSDMPEKITTLTYWKSYDHPPTDKELT